MNPVTKEGSCYQRSFTYKTRDAIKQNADANEVEAVLIIQGESAIKTAQRTQRH
jgi:hypothetical protein